MGWPEYIQHVIAHPYPDPMILGGVVVALAFTTWDWWRERQR